MAIHIHLPVRQSGKTKDADWSAKHMGNFRFEVTDPNGKKTSVQANTSAEAISKVKKGTKDVGAFISSKEIEQMLAHRKKMLEAAKRSGMSTTVLQGQVIEAEEALKQAKKREQTKDARPTIGEKVQVQTEPGVMVEGTVKRVMGNHVSVAYVATLGKEKFNRQSDFPVTKVYNKAGKAFSFAEDASITEYKGYTLKEFQPGKWMAHKGFANFGPASSLQELKTRLDKHLASVAAGGGAP